MTLELRLSAMPKQRVRRREVRIKPGRGVQLAKVVRTSSGDRQLQASRRLVAKPERERRVRSCRQIVQKWMRLGPSC